MVKMPDKTALGERDPTAQYSIPEFRANPIPGAIQNFGGAVSDLGGVLARKERMASGERDSELKKAQAERERAEKYGYTSKLLQFEAVQNDYLQKQSDAAQPGAANFANTAVTEYDKQARQFMADVPDHLKPEFDLKLFDLRSRIHEGATKFEREEGRRFAGNQIDDKIGRAHV